MAIARVLDVSIEYLVTDEEAKLRERQMFSILGGMEALDDDDYRVVLALVEALRKRQRKSASNAD